MRTAIRISSLGLFVIATAVSAAQLPHVPPGPRRLPPGRCGFTNRCSPAPAPAPCQISPRSSGCHRMPPTGNR
jgi:hypothetical protein